MTSLSVNQPYGTFIHKLTSLSINQPNGTFIHEPTVLLLCSRVNFALTEVNNKHNVSHKYVYGY